MSVAPLGAVWSQGLNREPGENQGAVFTSHELLAVEGSALAAAADDWSGVGGILCDPPFERPVLQELHGLHDESLSIWDPFDTLCSRSPCAAISAGMPLFFDGDHLSGYANELLYPSLVSFLLSR